MLSEYLNQTAEHKPCIGNNDRGQPLYGAAASVSCRKQSKTQNIITAAAQVVKTQHVYFLENAVAEGDLLDGKVVVLVQDWVVLDGDVIGYKAVV